MEGGFLSDLFRNIFGWLDSLIFGFISSVYNTFTNIASYTLINNDVMQTFNERVYALIGIFMLFKLTFSLITYFIDPDKFTDKNSGFGKLIQRVLISLVLLALVPSLFNLAFKAQTIILKENVLANLILGGEYDNLSVEDREKMYRDAGGNMAFTVLSAFMHPEDQSVLEMDDEELAKEYVDDPGAIALFKEYKQARVDNDINALVGWYKLNTKEDIDGYYLFSYTPVLSTIAGIAVLWILIVFCIDIGIRSVKLAFLQLIAPVPILGYIDATKGEKTFKSWISQCISTYLEIFMKLLAIYFVIFLITLITTNGFSEYVINENNELITQPIENTDFFAMALIIIGLLIFANQVPKLLGDLLGIKTEGFSLNPMKKIGQSPLAAGVVGGAIGLGVGTLANSANLVRNIKSNGLKKTFLGDGTHVDKDGNIKEDRWYDSARKIFRTTASPFAASAGARAFVSGMKGGSSSIWGNVRSGLRGSNDARYRRSQYVKAGYTPGQRFSDKVDDFVGYKNTYAGVGKMDEEVQILKNKAAEYDSRENRAREQMMDFESKYANKYGAETFNIGFARNEDGELLYQNEAGQTDYQKYVNYMNKINAERYQNGDSPITTITDDDVFDKYSNLEKNVNYYNVEHEKIKKEIKNKEKIISTRKSKDK